MRGIRVVVAAGLAGLLAGGLLVGPASAAILDPVTSLPAQVTMKYGPEANLDSVVVSLPEGGIACVASTTNGWTTRVVGRAARLNGAKVVPLTITGPTCANGLVSWTVTAKNLSSTKTPQVNAVVKFVSMKDNVQVVQSLVVKILPSTGKVTGKR